jgi:hypothetical protein
MPLHRLATFLFTAFLTSSLILIGCDSAEDGDENEIAGEYETTLFTAEIEDETVDVLAAGGFIEVTFREDGTVSGRLFVPEALAEGEENDIPFGGTYTVSGSEVTFDHEADTFIRDVEWMFSDGTLRAETDEISVVLRKE